MVSIEVPLLRVQFSVDYRNVPHLRRRMRFCDSSGTRKRFLRLKCGSIHFTRKRGFKLILTRVKHSPPLKLIVAGSALGSSRGLHLEFS